MPEFYTVPVPDDPFQKKPEGVFYTTPVDGDPFAGAQPGSKGTAVTRGLVSGIAQQTPENLADALEGASLLTGVPEVGGWAEKIRSLAHTPQGYETRTKSLSDVHGVSSGLTYAGERLGEGIASTAPSMLTGLAGAAVGSAAGPVGSAAGGFAGAAAPSFAQNYGDLYRSLKDEGVDKNDAARIAAYGALPIAGIDVVPVAGWVGRLSGTAKREAVRSLAKRIAAETLKGAGEEAAAEGAQQAIQEGIVAGATGKPAITWDRAKSVLESAIAGGLTGGVIGGATGLAPDRAPAAPPSPSQDAAPTPGRLALPSPAIPMPDRSGASADVLRVEPLPLSAPEQRRALPPPSTLYGDGFTARNPRPGEGYEPPPTALTGPAAPKLIEGKGTPLLPAPDGTYGDGFFVKPVEYDPFKRSVTPPPTLAPMIEQAAARAGIDPALYARQIAQESGFNPNAVSPKGAGGLAQIMPATARYVERKHGVDTSKPQGNLDGGALYMAEQMQRFNGDVRLALAAYNAGPARVTKMLKAGGDFTTLPQETQDYVAKILGSRVETPGTGGQPFRSDVSRPLGVEAMPPPAPAAPLPPPDSSPLPFPLRVSAPGTAAFSETMQAAPDVRLPSRPQADAEPAGAPAAQPAPTVAPLPPHAQAPVSPAAGIKSTETPAPSTQTPVPSTEPAPLSPPTPEPKAAAVQPGTQAAVSPPAASPAPAAAATTPAGSPVDFGRFNSKEAAALVAGGRERGKPVLDLRRRPTGWTEVLPTGIQGVDTGGVVLLHPTKLEARRFSGRHAAAYAQAYAIDNPVEPEASEPADLVVKPLFEKPAAAVEPTSAESADPLAAAGLQVRQTTTKGGKAAWEVTGDTKTHKDMLKRLGARWYGPKKAWTFYNGDPTAAIAGEVGRTPAVVSGAVTQGLPPRPKDGDFAGVKEEIRKAGGKISAAEFAQARGANMNEGVAELALDLMVEHGHGIKNADGTYSVAPAQQPSETSETSGGPAKVAKAAKVQGERDENAKTAVSQQEPKPAATGKLDRAMAAPSKDPAPGAQPSEEPRVPDAGAKTAEVITPTGRRVKVQYEVVEAATLKAATGDLQPRDRSRAASQAQIDNIARNLEPALLGESASATDGAPIISADGTVIGGNGRVAAIRRAYEMQGDGATKYRDFLAAAGHDVGGMRQPVLVRRMTDPMPAEQLAEIARETNQRSTLAMSVTEQAMADAKALTPGMMQLWRGGDVTAAGNRDFVRSFVRNALPQSEHAAFFGPDGSISQEGERRIQGAMLAAAYDDAALVQAVIESADSNIRALGGALFDVSRDWAAMRAAAADGAINPDSDITPNLIEAVNIVRRARDEGRNVAEFVGQGEMFGSASVSPLTEGMLRVFFKWAQFTQPRGRDAIASALGYYVEQAQQTKPGTDIFGAPPTSPQQLTGQVNEWVKKRESDRKPGAGTGDIFAEPAAGGTAGADAGSPGAGGPRPKRDGSGRKAADDRQPVAPAGRKKVKPATATRASLFGRATAPSANEQRAAERIIEIVKQIAPAADVRVVRELLLDVGAGPQEAGGSYEPLKRLVTVALNFGNPEQTAGHEAIHALRDMGVFTAEEDALLVKAAREKWIDQYDVRKHYPGASEEMLIEEGIAEAFADWRANPKAVQPPVARLFSRIRAFFLRLANALRGMGFRTVEDVFGAAASGEAGRRGRQTAGPAAEDTRASLFTHLRQAAPAMAQPDQKPGTAEQKAAIAAIIGKRDAKPWLQRVRETIRAYTDRGALELKQGFIDQFAAIEALEKGQGGGKLKDATESAYKATRMTRNLQSVMAHILRHGPIDVRDDPKTGGRWFRPRQGWKSGGFEDIFKPLAEKGLLDLWRGWAVAVRANRLMQEGRERLMSQEQIDALLPLGDQYPEFREAHRKWRAFNKAALDMAEAAGIINAEQRDAWENDDYVPFYRILDEQDGVGSLGRGKEGISGQRSGIVRLEGGKEQLADPIENMVRNLTGLIDRSYKNLAMQKVKDLAVDAGVMEKKTPKLASTIGDSIPAVSVMVDGKPEYYYVRDPLLLRAVTSMSPQQLGGVMALFRMAKRMLTESVTLDPAFMVANGIRDTLAAWVTTGQKGFRPGLDSMKGFVKALRADPSRLAIMAAGAGTGGYYGTAPEEARKFIERHTNRMGKESILDTPRKLWEAWHAIGQASESANRIAIFDAAKKSGATDAEAAFQALDLMDFGMRGDHAAMRVLIDMVPFLNARVQGLYRLGRGIAENPKRFLLRGSIVAGATLALLAANWDNPEYEALEDWDKDTYWHIWVGGQHYRLPKPFEVGALFATIPERMFRALLGRDTTKASADAAVRMAMDTFAFNPTPQLVAPLVEQFANKDMFTGRPIEGVGMERLPPGMRARPDTSETAQEVGEALNVSPLRIQHLVGGYFGTLGLHLLAAADQFVEWASNAPVEPSLRIDEIPIVQRFMRDDPARTTRFVTEFYGLRREVAQAMAGFKELQARGQAEEARAFLADRRDKLAMFKGFEKAADVMSEMNKASIMIRRSPDMTADQKRERLDAITRQRNELARVMVERAASTAKIIQSLSENETARNNLVASL